MVEYPEIAEGCKKFIKDNEHWYFASLAQAPENGIEGKRDGFYVVRSKLDGGDILARLDAQIEANISRGSGLEARFDLGNEIISGTQTFMQSLVNLRPSDIIQYIEGLSKVKVTNEEDFEEKSLAELSNGSDQEKDYAEYLTKRVKNAVMEKNLPLAYQIRAQINNSSYKKAA
jgi:hypothetical protein